MARELKEYQLIERSIIKKYRKNIWNPFIEGVKKYSLVRTGDRIIVDVKNNASSMLLAKLMQQLQRVSYVDFELGFRISDSARDNADRLNIPDCMIDYNKSTCTTCFDDVVAGLLNSMMYKATVSVPLPLYKNDGVDIIAPLFCVKEENISAFVRYNSLEFDAEDTADDSMLKTKELLRQLHEKDKDIEHSIFKSIHSVCLDTMLGYEADNTLHSFLEGY